MVGKFSHSEQLDPLQPNTKRVPGIRAARQMVRQSGFDPSIVKVLMAPRVRPTEELIAGLATQATVDRSLGQCCQDTLALQTSFTTGRLHQLEQAATKLIMPRWNTAPVSTLTVADLSDWYMSLRAPSNGSKPIKRFDLASVNVVIQLGLQLAMLQPLLPNDRLITYIDYLKPVWQVRRPLLPAGGTPVGIGIGVAGPGLAVARSRRGGKDSLAYRIPYIGSSHLYVTDKHVVAVPQSQMMAQLLPQMVETSLITSIGWQLPRSEIVEVKKNVRIQLQRRFRFQFSDGSSAAFFIGGKASIPLLQSLLSGQEHKSLP